MKTVKRRHTDDKPITTIIADDRERGADVVDCLRRMPAVHLDFRRLSLGDYLIDDQFLVERKTIQDFLLSLLDGRLFSQACRLVNCEKYRPFIILEGTAKTDEKPLVARSSIQGAIITLTLILNIPLLRSRNADETSRLICFAGRQACRRIRNSVPRSGYRPKGKYRRRLFVLQGLPGIGPERAKRLLDEFGTVQNALQATAETLTKVDGIGRKTALAIRNIVAEDTE